MKGKLILYPQSMISAQRKFKIFIDPISKKIYHKSGEILPGSDFIELATKEKPWAPIQIDPSYSMDVPFVMVEDELYPINQHWQDNFSLAEVGKSFNISIIDSALIKYAKKSEDSKMYLLELEKQTIKLNSTELNQLKTLLIDTDYTLQEL